MNVELAMAALADAKADQEHFDMASFFHGREEFVVKGPGILPCWTTACYAGFVCLRVAPKGSLVRDSRIFEPGSRSVHAEEYATKALEIRQDQADVLFYVENIDQVEAVLNYLADNPDASSYSLRSVVSW